MVRTHYATSKKFSLNIKTILRWAATKSRIKESKKGSKYIKHTAKGEKHAVEAVLYQEYKEYEANWFKLRARQLLSDKNPESNFGFSDGWFTAFKKR